MRWTAGVSVTQKEGGNSVKWGKVFFWESNESAESHSCEKDGVQC